MKTYTVTAQMTVSCSLYVEAETVEEALGKAKRADVREWDVEKDGEPSDFQVDEL